MRNRGGACPRRRFLILLDNGTGARLRGGGRPGHRRPVRRYAAFPDGVQPSIMLDEFPRLRREPASNSPAFREAMRKRGIEDVSLVMVDAWSAGHYGNEAPRGSGASGSFAAAFAGSALEPHGNFYARPIENIVAVVDLESQAGDPDRGFRRRTAAHPGRQLDSRLYQGAGATISSRWTCLRRRVRASLSMDTK